MANSQHRCVFVGNIPYDATEEQLIQICEEVGPVVSFRLVIDRETGKPKGYGFCEYKDEETALSARRNLQGYEINGRQLRVDFAENDKNNDRSREQGRGGPGMASNTDSQKQFGGPAVHGDSGLHQPVGVPVAMAAAAVMAGALGGAQTGSNNFNENVLPSQQPVLGTDSLTLQLAKMSRNQLNEILSEIKALAMQNKEQARQLLLSTPQLPKAIFQAQIMLGMVSPHMLQMPNIRQASGPLLQPLVKDGQPGQQTAVQTFPGLPPLAQNKVHFGLNPQPHQAQVPVPHPNALVHNQYGAPSQFAAQPRFQNPVLHQGPLPGHSGVSALPPIQSQQLANVSVGPPVQQVQPPMIQHPSQVGSSNLGPKSQMVAPNATVQPSLLNRPPLLDHGFQPSTSIMSGLPNNVNKNSDRLPQVTNDPAWARTSQGLPSSGLSKKESMARENPDQSNRPSKMVKLDDGRGTPFLEATARASTSSVPVSSQAFVMSGNQIHKAEAPSNSDKQVSQLPPDVENALLQQVLNLTPEQVSSLPPDQQQQVLQLQQMLRQPS